MQIFEKKNKKFKKLEIGIFKEFSGLSVWIFSQNFLFFFSKFFLSERFR